MMITNISKHLEVIDLHIMVKRSRYFRVEIHPYQQKPNISLSNLEKDGLRQSSLDFCIFQYTKRFKSFLNEEETIEDLRSEAKLGFEEMLLKFDKSRMKPNHTVQRAFQGTWVKTIKYHVNKSIKKTKENNNWAS